MNNKNERREHTRVSSIVALVIVSESEIQVGYPDYSADWEEKNPEKLLAILYDLGMDTSKVHIRQDGLWHRNRLNEVVLCSRFVGHERQDCVWLTSGYASQEAKDKASGSRLLEDMYRAKNLTEDTQHSLEVRDRYRVVDPEYD